MFFILSKWEEHHMASRGRGMLIPAFIIMRNNLHLSSCFPSFESWNNSVKENKGK